MTKVPQLINMLNFRIDIKNKAGTTTYTSITQIVSLAFTEKLSRIGSFTLQIPLDGTVSDEVQANRYLYLYETTGSDVEFFGGIIRQVSRRINASGSVILTATGECLLSELRETRVGGLIVYEWGWTSPAVAQMVAPSSNTDLPNAIDGDTGTNETFYFPSGNYLYFGNYQPSRALRYTIGGGTYSSVGAATVQGFFQGGNWEAVTSLTDGTLNSGDTLRQSGDVTFDDLTNLQQKETHDNLLLHWLRHTFNDGGNITGFVLQEVEIETRIPTTACLAPIIAFDSDWSLVTNTTTSNPALQEFFNDSMLEAFVIIQQQTGEQFRRGTGRQLAWLRSSTSSSGVTLTGTPGLPAVGTGYIETMVETEYQVKATRLYVTGAGMGAGLIDMSLADTSTVSIPSGWTFDRANNAIINTTAETALGHSIALDFELKNVAAIGSSGASVQASNILLQAGIAKLQDLSDSTRKSYELMVTGLQEKILPYETVDVSYTHNRSGSAVWTVSETLIVIENKATIDSDGRMKNRLIVATIDELDVSAESELATILKTGQVHQRHRQTINTLDVDGAAGGSGLITDSIPPGTYLTPSDLATHTADENAHHNRLHNLLDTDDHSITGSAGQVVGLTATDTLGLITPVSDGDATKGTILKTDSNGDLTVTDLVFVTELRRGSAGTHTKFGASGSVIGDPTDAHFDFTHISGISVFSAGSSTSGVSNVAALSATQASIQVTSYGTGGTAAAIGNLGMQNETIGFYFGVVSGTYGSAFDLGGEDARGKPFITNVTTAGWESEIWVHGHDGVKVLDDYGAAFFTNNGINLQWSRNMIPTATDTFDIGSETFKFLRFYGSELRVELFAKDIKTFSGGWVVIPHQSSKLPSAVGTGDTTIDFGSDVTINAGDFIELRTLSGGSPVVEYISADSLSAGTTWNVTRNLDGSGANAWGANQVFHVLGQSSNNNGRIELDAQNGPPRIRVITQGVTYGALEEPVRLGDLNGWGSFSAVNYGIAIGDSADQYLTFDANSGTLAVKGEFSIQGNSNFDGVVGISTTGGIYQGTGTFASPTTGLKISNSSGVGRLETYLSGTRQIEINTSGRLVAGSGDETTLDANGLTITNNSTTGASNDPTNIAFTRQSTGDVIGTIHGFHNGLTGVNEAYTMRFILNSIGGGNDSTIDMTEFVTGNSSSIILTSDAISLIGSVSGISASGDLSVTGDLSTLQDLDVGGEIVNSLGSAVIFGEPINYGGTLGDVWIEPGNWQTPTLLNSWLTYSVYNVRYRFLPTGHLEIAGAVDPGSFTNGVVFNVPAAYRPTRLLIGNGFGYTGASYQSCQIQVQTDGDVAIFGHTSSWDWISFDGLQLPLTAP